MENTKHDLSAGESTVYLEDLISVATIALSMKRDAINRNLHALYDRTKTNFHHEARNILADAKHLAIAAETLYVLQESRDRKITVVKGKVKR